MNQSNEHSALGHETNTKYLFMGIVIVVGTVAFGAGIVLTVCVIIIEWKTKEQHWDTKLAVIGGTIILHVALPIASTIFILQYIPRRLTKNIFCAIDEAWTDKSVNSQTEIIVGERDTTNTVVTDIELEVLKGTTQLSYGKELIEDISTSLKITENQTNNEFVVLLNSGENVASSSPLETDQNISNTTSINDLKTISDTSSQKMKSQVFSCTPFTPTQSSYCFEYSRKLSFGCASIIIIICSSVVPLSADIYLHITQCRNETLMNDPLWRHRINARLAAYLCEMFLTPFALVYLLYIYYSCAMKSDRIKRHVLINGDLNYAMKQIKELSLSISRLHQNSQQRLQLVCAHRFANMYVISCMSFGFAYLWYVRTWAPGISNDFFIKFIGHFLAYGCLVCMMWKTNGIVDRMKATVLLVGSSGHPRITNINLQDRDKLLFQLAVERCESYAYLCYRKVSLPGVLATVLPAAVSLFTPYIKQRLRLYEFFTDKE